MDGFIMWLVTSSSVWIAAESLNCMYPYHNGETNNEGIICQWEQDSFYYNEECDKWILNQEDEDDNWIEARSRKKYWEKRGE